MSEWIALHGTEVLGFVTGAVCVILALRRNVWTYPVGLANNAVFVVLFLGAGLYANAGLQVVFAVFGIHGWWRWTRRVEQDRAYIGRTPRRAVPVLIGSGLAGAALLGWVLTSWIGAREGLGWLDAGTTAVSLVAQYMLNRKWIQTWWVWFAVDLVYIGLYWTAGLPITAVLYAGFAALCVTGYVSWRRVEREQAAEAGQDRRRREAVDA